ncbi:MAG: flagellar basal-body MS-ring/collar protein FliF [Bacillota bacterium]
MNDSIEKMKRQLNEFYTGLNTSQKIKIGVSALLIVLSLALLVYFTSKPEYVTLYDNLTAKDAGEITKKLEEMGIPWKNGKSTTSIMVPQEYQNKALMDLAVEGFPKEGFTFEDMLNSSSLTMTNDERKKRYIIALQNTLQNTIKEIEGVNAAVVNLSVADDSNFLIEQQKSKASVFVELNGGSKLSEDQVDGIVMLVSKAVKDLDPEDISVIDNNGRVLNKKANNDLFSASTQIQMQQQVQDELKNSIEQFLSTVFGPGNVAVMANVKLDFDSEITDIQEFSPPIEGETTGIIRSMSELNEQVVNGVQGGIPGTDTNAEGIPQYPENTGDASKYDKANKTINYEINEIKKKIVKAQGQIQDITVAVLINNKALVDQELTDEYKEEIINLVSASAGLDTRVVEVMAKDFDTSLSDQLAGMQDANDKGFFGSIPIWSIAVLAVLLLAGLGFGVYQIRKRKAEVEDILDKPIVNPELAVAEIDLEMGEKSAFKKQIDKFIDRNPEAVAQLLKNWLNED